MKKIISKLTRIFLVLTMALAMIPAMAEDVHAAEPNITLTELDSNTYICYVNHDSHQNIANTVTHDTTGDITVILVINNVEQTLVNMDKATAGGPLKSFDAGRSGSQYQMTMVFAAPTKETEYEYTQWVHTENGMNERSYTFNVTFKPNTVANTMTLSSTSGTLTYPNGTTITANNNNGGAITATSSNNNVATASVSGNNITITPAAVTADNQKATITVKSAKKDNVLEGTKTYNVTVNRGTFTLTPTAYTGNYDKNSHKATIKSSIDGVKIVSGASTSYGSTAVNSSTANTSYDLAPFYTNVPGGTVYYQGTRNGYKPVTGSTKVTINKAPAYNKNNLSDEQKPTAVEGLKYVGTPTEPTSQNLVEGPTADLPEGYDHVEYSIDGGKTWTTSLAQGTRNGDYTVKVKYVGDNNHENFMGNDITVTIDKNDDQIEADKVITLINGLPAELEVETTDRTAIEAARSAYEDYLTAEQKAWVEDINYSNNAMGKLKAAELGLVKADAIAEVKEYQKEVEDSDVYDDQGRSEFATILENAEKDIKAATSAEAVAELVTSIKNSIDNVNTKAENDRIAADKVIASIKENTLEDPTKVTTENAEKINKAKADYDGLTDDQKTLVDEDEEGATTKRLNDNLDSLEAAKVEDMIDDLLPLKDLKEEDKERVDAARKAYEELKEDEKKYVDSTRLKNLETAEVNTIKDLLNNLPNGEDVTLDDKDAIEAARKAYEDLTDAQKAKVGKGALGQLEGAEEALKAAEVKKQIEDLKSPEEITTADEETINAARKAYDELNDYQKELVGEPTKDKLEKAEEAIPAAKVEDLINDLPAENDVTTADKEDIEAARKAYEALNDAQKALVDGNKEGATKKKLEDAEFGIEKAAAKDELDKYKEAKEKANIYDEKGKKELADEVTAGKNAINAAENAETLAKALKDAKDALDKVNTKAQNDKEAADAAKALINALPEDKNDVTTADKEDIEAARKAYDDLTEDQKKLVDKDTVKALEEAEKALTAAGVEDQINALTPKEEITTEDKEAIKAARDAYGKLKDDEKKYVDEEALKTLADAEKALSDAEIQDVVDKINNLPDEITLEDKEAVEAARKAYDDLTDAQKAKIKRQVKGRLEDSEEALKDLLDEAAATEVEGLINELPAKEEVTEADKNDVEAARKAYNDLTDDQKAKVSPEAVKKLEDAEKALKDAEDEAAADAVEKEIDELPAAGEVTPNDKKAIEDARKAYDALTKEQKAKVSPEAVKKLEDAEKALKNAEDKAAADKVKEAINKLPSADEVTTGDKKAIEDARKAYNALTDDQKKLVDKDAVKALEDAEKALKDETAADKVEDTINKLPEANKVTTGDKKAIENARKAYDALTNDQKAKVSPEAKKKLEDAEKALKNAEDEAAADKVEDTINKLPAANKVTTKDKKAIEDARKAYNALTKDQKSKVSPEALKKLEAAEKALKDEAAADKVEDTINKLPAANKVTTKDKKAIEDARKAYNALTKDQKAKVDPKAVKKLEDAEKALKEASIVHVKSVKLDKTSATLIVGDTTTLKATVAPTNADNKKVTWKSSNTNVATVQNGKVTAKKAGTATITVTAEDGSKKATCKITVNNPTKISLDKTKATIGARKIGKYTNTVQLKATVTGGNGNKKVTWKSSNTKVAKVDANGKVTAVADLGVKAASTVTITATTSDGKKASATITVEDPVSAFVRRLYKYCLNRTPDASGFEYWTTRLTKKQITAAEAVKGFYESKEMANMKLSNSEYIERCYLSMMDRKSDNGGKNYWNNKLKSGESRMSVVKGFVDSNEFTKICKDFGINKGTITLAN